MPTQGLCADTGFKAIPVWFLNDMVFVYMSRSFTDRNTSAKMTVQFEAFEVPGGREYYGHVLPYGLKVTTPSGSDTDEPLVNDAAAALSSLAQSGEITELLNRHGAVLIRGVGHASAETFSKLVNAIEESRGSRPYEQIGLAGKRTVLGKNVWTANEGSPTTRFYQHNEVCAHGPSTRNLD
jgi:hypothetical protein